MLGHTVDKNDGTFWMELADYKKYFTHLWICRLYNDIVGQQYFRYMFHGEWTGATAGGSSNNTTWANNPQYSLVVHNPKSNVIVSLAQQDCRLLNNREDHFPIAFSIFKTNDATHRVQSPKNEFLKTGVFQHRREVCLEMNLEPGFYVIVPATYDKGQNAKFTISAYSNFQLTFNFLKLSGEIQTTHGNPMETLPATVEPNTLPQAYGQVAAQRAVQTNYGGSPFPQPGIPTQGYGGMGQMPPQQPYAQQGFPGGYGGQPQMQGGVGFQGSPMNPVPPSSYGMGPPQGGYGNVPYNGAPQFGMPNAYGHQPGYGAPGYY